MSCIYRSFFSSTCGSRTGGVASGTPCEPENTTRRPAPSTWWAGPPWSPLHSATAKLARATTQRWRNTRRSCTVGCRTCFWMKFSKKFQIFRSKMTTTLFREEAYTIEWINYPVQGPSFPPGTTNVIIEFKGVDGQPDSISYSWSRESSNCARLYEKQELRSVGCTSRNHGNNIIPTQSEVTYF